MDLSSKIHTATLDLQQLKASDGPTALVVIHVQLKTLLFDLLQADPANSRFIQAYNLLSESSWKEASAMLDYYEQDQDQAYQSAFNRIKELIEASLKQLS